MAESELLTWARYYLSRGFSVVPVSPETKKATVPWAEFQTRLPTDKEITDWFSNSKNTGIGIVTGGLSGLCVIDVDSHKKPEAIKQIKPYLPEDDIYPVARSQSGGWHLYFRCNGELRGNVNTPFEGIDLRANGNYIVAPPTPGYTWKRSIKDFILSSLTSFYINSLNININIKEQDSCQSRDSYTKLHEATRSYISFTEGQRDESLFHVANSLTRGGMSLPDIRKVLNMLAENCKPPFDKKEIEIKIQSAIQRAESRIENITKEVRDWVLATSGYFLTTSCHTELHLATKEQKRAANAALSRMVKENIIERYGDKRGSYRLVENKIEEIKWRDTLTNAINFKWPFGIEKMVKLHPGSLVVIAGEQNAGKTAFLVNLIKLNMNQGQEIYYASSEFGGEELKERLFGFEDMQIDDWNFHFYNRSDNFQDVVQPNTINLFDYLEISDNFYQIGGKLKLIHDKLKKGIVVVALQKDAKASQGRGGSFSLEKPRLYLNLITNFPGQILQIRKAKNWVDKYDNPNGKEIEFSIFNGCVLTAQGNWYRPERGG